MRGFLMVAAVACAAADQTGAQISMSQAGVQYILEAAIPLVEHAVDTFPIPDISGEKDGFDYSMNGVSCSSFTIGSSSATMDAATGLNLALGDIGLACHGSWSFKLKSWPHIPDGSGSVDITVGSTSATLDMDISASGTHPFLTPSNVALNIGSFNIDFHGSLWDWLLDIFKGLLQDAIKKAVDSAFSSAITSVVDKDVNPALAAIKMEYPLHVRAPYDIAEIRFGLTGNPVFTTTYMGLGVEGDVVPIAAPVSPPITPPALPAFNPATADHYLQMQLSSYTFLSAVYTFYSANLLEWNIPSSEIPLGFNSTVAYLLIAPGFPLEYPDAPVQINLDFTSMPTIDITSAGVAITAPLQFDFLATAPNGTVVSAFTLGALTSLSAELTIGPDANGTLALLGKLAYLDANLTVLQTNVGSVQTGLLQTLINFLFKSVVVPLVNDIFANGVPLPSVDGVTLTDTVIVYGDEFFTIASDFTLAAAAANVQAAVQTVVTKALPALLRGAVTA